MKQLTPEDMNAMRERWGRIMPEYFSRYPGAAAEQSYADVTALMAHAETQAARLDVLEAQRGMLRSALDWLVHLHHGVSKDGTNDISSAEWEAALVAAEQALGESS